MEPLRDDLELDLSSTKELSKSTKGQKMEVKRCKEMKLNQVHLRRKNGSQQTLPRNPG